MKIVEIIPISFKGTLSQRNMTYKEFIILHDNGIRETVKIPNIDYIINQFKWMSDNDRLRHLYELEPTVSINDEDLRKQEEEKYFHYKATMMPSSRTPYSRPFDFSLEYEITWEFIDLNTALQFKLVFANDIDG